MGKLVGMFLLGIAGSAVVVLISIVQDGKELFGKDEGELEPGAVFPPVHFV